MPYAFDETRLVADDDIVKRATDQFDSSFHASVARSTMGLSPAALAEAYLDWFAHLSASPGKQVWLGWKGARKALRFGMHMAELASGKPDLAPIIAPLPNDRRFADSAWQSWPYNAYYQGFLSWQQWLHNTTTEVRGVSEPHERIVSFVTRQMLDMLAPSNFPLTNPVVLQRSLDENGANFQRGFEHLMADISATAAFKPGEAKSGNPAVGETVAITPGQVVLRNRLIELIQYTPTTPNVRPEPVLIVPAWIMKYYILDLSAQNSLVRYLVDRGFTVFMVSWHNPDRSDRQLGMDDYLRLGVMEAIKAATAITASPTLHAVGYCLGGTLLSIAAAAMARDGDTRLRSVSLFAAQHDFTDAGEMRLFINESQIALLEDVMAEQGYLEASQMSGAFQILHSNDLIWSHMIESLLLGEEMHDSDLMAWNRDATRLPARMHSEYLRQLFLNNDLAEGRYCVGLTPVAISDIHLPFFVVGTRTDHVAPWRSVYKIHLISDAEVTFVLTSGGHNAGIVSEPGHPRRSFHHQTRPVDGLYISPDEWERQAALEQGSWWPLWADWLSERSRPPTAPPPMGLPNGEALPTAPGRYVFET